MVRFIKQEAEEKANEIKVSAEEVRRQERARAQQRSLPDRQASHLAPFQGKACAVAAPHMAGRGAIG